MTFEELIDADDLDTFRARVADIDEEDEWLLGEALWAAALTPNRVPFLRLLAPFADVNDPHEDGDTLIMKVVASGDLGGAATLLELGADLCQRNGSAGCSVLHEDGDTLIMKVVASGDLGGAATLLELGADLCQRNGSAGCSVLHVAKSAAMLDFLLKSGAHAVINAQTTERWTALHLHASENRADCVQMLLQHGADPQILTRERIRLDDKANFDKYGGCKNPLEVIAPGRRAIDLTTSEQVRAVFEAHGNRN
jgi:ankyrin repeat protein